MPISAADTRFIYKTGPDNLWPAFTGTSRLVGEQPIPVHHRIRTTPGHWGELQQRIWEKLLADGIALCAVRFVAFGNNQREPPFCEFAVIVYVHSEWEKRAIRTAVDHIKTKILLPYPYNYKVEVAAREGYIQLPCATPELKSFASKAPDMVDPKFAIWRSRMSSNPGLTVRALDLKDGSDPDTVAPASTHVGTIGLYLHDTRTTKVYGVVAAHVILPKASATDVATPAFVEGGGASLPIGSKRQIFAIGDLDRTYTEIDRELERQRSIRDKLQTNLEDHEQKKKDIIDQQDAVEKSLSTATSQADIDRLKKRQKSLEADLRSCKTELAIFSSSPPDVQARINILKDFKERAKPLKNLKDRYIGKVCLASKPTTMTGQDPTSGEEYMFYPDLAIIDISPNAFDDSFQTNGRNRVWVGDEQRFRSIMRLHPSISSYTHPKNDICTIKPPISIPELKRNSTATGIYLFKPGGVSDLSFGYLPGHRESIHINGYGMVQAYQVQNCDLDNRPCCVLGDSGSFMFDKNGAVVGMICAVLICPSRDVSTSYNVFTECSYLNAWEDVQKGIDDLMQNQEISLSLI